MTRRISDRSNNPIQDYFEEYKKIEYLFSEVKCIGTFNRYGRRMDPMYTLEEYLSELQFYDWNLRGRCITLQELRNSLGITQDCMNNQFSTDRLLDYLQFILNCMIRIELTLKACSVVYLIDESLLNMIIENTKSVLEQLNYSIVIDNNNDEIYIVYQSPETTAVSEIHDDIKESVTEYRRHDFKGDLKRKEEILCTLYKKLEAIEKDFQGTEYDKLLKDTKFLFNKSGVRHFVEEDKIASKTFMNMSPDEIEKWYDRIYDLFLTCMLMSDYLKIRKSIKELKRIDDDNL